MADLTLAPISPTPAQTTTDLIFDTLYTSVVTLQLPPGSKVTETEIAKQLDVSRQPVRDAFFRLSVLGFLSIRPQRATLITKISRRAVLEAAFVRTALEVECIRVAARNRTAAGIEALRDNLARQERALPARDRMVFHVLDEEFHTILCNIAGHGHVWDLIREQKAHMDRVRFLTLSETRRRDVYAEHIAIVDAIEAGDEAEAERRQRAHLGSIRRDMPEIHREHPAYFEDETA